MNAHREPEFPHETRELSGVAREYLADHIGDFVVSHLLE